MTAGVGLLVWTENYIVISGGWAGRTRNMRSADHGTRCNG